VDLFFAREGFLYLGFGATQHEWAKDFVKLSNHLNVSFLCLQFGLGLALTLLWLCYCVPVVEGLRGFEYLWDEKVHKTPKLMKVILQWGACK
jgi:hypothetical protein